MLLENTIQVARQTKLQIAVILMLSKHTETLSTSRNSFAVRKGNLHPEKWDRFRD